MMFINSQIEINSYKKIPFWENKRRHTRLIDFRRLIMDYFNKKPRSDFLNDDHDTEDSSQLRTKLNMIIDATHEMITTAGILPMMQHGVNAVQNSEKICTI